jgi:hypothetical protein
VSDLGLNLVLLSFSLSAVGGDHENRSQHGAASSALIASSDNTLVHEDVFHAGVGVLSQDLMDGRGAGDETAVCDSLLKLVPFGTHIKQRLDRMLKDPVTLVPDSRLGFSHCPGSDGDLTQGKSLVFVVLVATRNFLYPGIIIDKTAFASP